MDNNEYLAHHGIKGQRWGVEHGPPYPVRRGSGGKPKTTNIVKSKLKEALDKRAEAKKAKQADHEARVARIKDQRAEKKAEAEVNAHEKLRQEIVKNPKKIYKHKDSFSKDELKSMIEDIKYNRSIEDVRLDEIKRGKEKLQLFRDTLNTTVNALTDAKNMYNLAAEFNNMLVDSGKSKGPRWTKLGENPNNSNNSNQSNSGNSQSNNASKSNNGGKKPDTSKKMSDPAVSNPTPKTKATVDRTIKRYGTNAMSTVDRAMSFMEFNGPMSFYNSNPEVYTRFLNR